jgi:crotonobetainyl-CoA:carnitine CoA-transferase CaiB-like acyl-CoA transferase
VVDLSALWAGPLCGELLARAGADVVKVESLARPDGARHGPAAFFDLMNGPKRSVALDLATSGGQRDLRRLIDAADVVIESARPRALEQMGIVAAEVLRGPAGPQVWTSITSHGRGPGQADRVGFGDVAAAAGGLVAHDDQGPCFLADAVADPLCGLVAAAAVLEALVAGGRWLLSVALAPLSAAVAGPAFSVHGAPAHPPRARPAVRPAPPLGSDTAAVLGGLAL